MTKVLTKARAHRALTLADACVGRYTIYTEDENRGSIVRRGILNPQMYPRDGVTLEEDCSSDIIGISFAAGLPDPGGYSYRAVGNTTSLRNHLRHIATTDVRPGDLILYTNPAHVAMVLDGEGHTADVYTFGHPTHPVMELANYRETDAPDRGYDVGLVFLSKILGHRR